MTYAQEGGALYEQHLDMAKKAERRGDWVEAEAWYQKADHCQRILNKPSGASSRLPGKKADATGAAANTSHLPKQSAGGRPDRRASAPSWGGYLRQNRRKPFKKDRDQHGQSPKKQENWHDNAS